MLTNKTRIEMIILKSVRILTRHKRIREISQTRRFSNNEPSCSEHLSTGLDEARFVKNTSKIIQIKM